LLFAAGGGEYIVGAVSYSDYPEAAKRITPIGDSQQLDIERIIALKPDLLVVWQTGNAKRQLEQLRQLGIPIFYSEPRKLDDIPDSILRLAQLLDTIKQAQRTTSLLRQELVDLSMKYSKRPMVRVFYQVWDKPLYTLGGQHIVNDVIRICGGENIFASMKALAPSVSAEAVLQKNPEAIFGENQSDQTGGVYMWKRYPVLTAVRRGNLFSIDSDLLSRSGPRMVAGARAVCEQLEQARQHR
jgi:iron complex transport system substrate-binding protein